MVDYFSRAKADSIWIAPQIRIDDTSRNANSVMADVFTQYAEFITERTERVRAAAAGAAPTCARDG